MIEDFSKKGKRKRQRNLPQQTSAAFNQYMKIISQFNEADMVIIVLDARNPIASRYAPFEAILKNKVCFALNKIDQAPRESVRGWLAELRKICPTFAISAIRSIQPLKEFIDEHNYQNVLVTGVKNVGKTTIAKQMDVCNETESWEWLRDTPDLVVMGALPLESFELFIIASARDFINRCSIHSLADVFKLTYVSDIDVVLLRLDASRKAAANKFFTNLQCNTLHYYSPPPNDSLLIELELTESQSSCLLHSPRSDTICVPLMVLSRGTENVLHPSLRPLLIKYTQSIDQ